MNAFRTGVAVLALLLLAVPVAAHVPSFPVDNTTPERAVAVPDPVKSWSFYDRLGAGEVKYYRASLDAGQRLEVGTFTPQSGAFTPSVVVMSPSLNATDDVPAGVTVPDGMGAVVVEGERPTSATYEPFAPSANYQTARVTMPVEEETTYLVAIYEPTGQSGPAGVTLGYTESFSLVEYVSVPFDLVRTHLWEGQNLFVAVGPLFLVVLGGLGFLRARWERAWTNAPVRVLLAVAGLVIVGSGVNTLAQMVLAVLRTGPTSAVLVTAAFVVVPLLCGGWVLWLALRDEPTLTMGTRVGLLVSGTLALLTWAGFIVGTVILVAVAVTPARFVRDQ
ncbi:MULTISPECIES: hypothetical protein [Haloferax]|uniref:Uncharacterized protein n=1 Tax=Haloferax marinum TaxID=2666143 RepID=A0A6A8GAU9_9EURY|nr:MULTISPECIES: hypothetical protein [Haloferax]KAB1191238.1 hypothetical protein Hfx1150_16315 [Haloferax sp. CBA1150]MRW98131.1 hypothetical protein [Haloferax marinum]